MGAQSTTIGGFDDDDNNDVYPATDLDHFTRAGASGSDRRAKPSQVMQETIPEEMDEEGAMEEDLEMGGAQDGIVDESFEVNASK